MFSSTLRHEHGWYVVLSCPQCGFEGKPTFLGWTPTREIHFGNTATMFANLACPRCSSNLRKAGAEKLRDLFSHIGVPRKNKLLMASFVICIGLLTLASSLLNRVFAGYGPLIPVMALGPLIVTFNWAIHRIRHRCGCGHPQYLFMGLLGRSCCYRCSSCGNLLRLRD